MNRYFAIIILILALNEVCAQSQYNQEKHHSGYGYNTIYEAKLFDTAEIRIRHFKSAYLIYHPCNWSTGNNVTADTFLIYHFDSSGLVQKKCYRDNTGELTTCFMDKRRNVTRSFRVSKLGDTLQDDTYNGSVDTLKPIESYSRIKDGLDSIFTTLRLEQVGINFDTLFYFKTVVGENGKVKESLTLISKTIARINHMMSTKTHYKYVYDDKGRLVTEKNLVSSKTNQTSYFDETINACGRPYRPAQGEVYETIDDTNNRLLNAEIKFKDEDGVITLTTKQKHVIITPLEKGSQLVKLLTVIVTDGFPTMEYYEVIYK